MISPDASRQRLSLLFILLLAMCLRLPAMLTVYHATVTADHIFGTRMINNNDSREYVWLSENIIERGQYTADRTEPFQPNIVRVPGYPLFLSLLYVLAGFQTSPALILLANALLSCLSIVLVKEIGERLFTPVVGLVASAIYAIAPITIALMAQAMSETLFTTCLLASVYFAIRVAPQDPQQTHYHNLGWGILAAILLGFSVNIRAIAIVIFPLFIVLWALRYALTPSFLRLSLVATFAYIACLTPWLVRNQQTFGYMTFSSISDINLMGYNAASVKAHREGISLRQARDDVHEQLGDYITTMEARQGKALTAKQVNEARRAIAMEILLANPLETALYHAIDMIHILRPGYSQMNLILEDDPQAYGNNVNTGSLPDPSELPFKQFVIFGYMTVYYGLLYLLTAAGIGIIIYRRQFYAFLVVCALPFWFAYVPSVAGNSRFRVPIEGFMALLSAIAVSYMLRYLTRWFQKHPDTSGTQKNPLAHRKGI